MQRPLPRWVHSGSPSRLVVTRILRAGLAAGLCTGAQVRAAFVGTEIDMRAPCSPLGRPRPGPLRCNHPRCWHRGHPHSASRTRPAVPPNVRRSFGVLLSSLGPENLLFRCSGHGATSVPVYCTEHVHGVRWKHPPSALTRRHKGASAEVRWLLKPHR